MDTFGATFQPNSGSDDPLRKQQHEGDAVQQAIQILALRLPKFLGAQGAAPRDLLANGGAAALGAGNVSESVLQALFGANRQGDGLGSQSPSSSNNRNRQGTHVSMGGGSGSGGGSGYGKPRVHMQEAPAPVTRPNIGGYGMQSGSFRPDHRGQLYYSGKNLNPYGPGTINNQGADY